jgi:hypothetical protein
VLAGDAGAGFDQLIDADVGDGESGKCDKHARRYGGQAERAASGEYGSASVMAATAVLVPSDARPGLLRQNRRLVRGTSITASSVGRSKLAGTFVP